MSSHYDDVLNELKEKGEKLANRYIVELYNILRDEEKLRPEDCRAKIEHDCIDLWSKATIRKYLPPEARDPKKQQAGKIGGENKKKKEAMLMAATAGNESSQSIEFEENCLVSQNEQYSAGFNLAENASISQKEEESTTFHNQLNQQLSTRALSAELLEANKIIADRDKEIEELKKDNGRLLNEYQLSNRGQLLLRNRLAMDIYNAISSSSSAAAASSTIPDFMLEYDKQEVIAVHPASVKINNDGRSRGEENKKEKRGK